MRGWVPSRLGASDARRRARARGLRAAAFNSACHLSRPAYSLGFAICSLRSCCLRILEQAWHCKREANTTVRSLPFPSAPCAPTAL